MPKHESCTDVGSSAMRPPPISRRLHFSTKRRFFSAPWIFNRRDTCMRLPSLGWNFIQGGFEKEASKSRRQFNRNKTQNSCFHCSVNYWFKIAKEKWALIEISWLSYSFWPKQKLKNCEVWSDVSVFVRTGFKIRSVRFSIQNSMCLSLSHDRGTLNNHVGADGVSGSGNFHRQSRVFLLPPLPPTPDASLPYPQVNWILTLSLHICK